MLTDGSNSQNQYYVIAIIVPLLLTICGLLHNHFRKYMHQWRHGFTDEDRLIEISSSDQSRLDSIAVNQEDVTLYLNGDIIGKGHATIIYKTEFRGSEGAETVAVRTLRENEIKKSQVEKLLIQAANTSKYQHNNVLSVIGICWPISGPPYLLLPHMSRGDLRTLLQQNGWNFSRHDLIHMAWQICTALIYSSCYNIIHRNLAASNCLVDENYVVKVKSFGLYYHKSQIEKAKPEARNDHYKWCALETLETDSYTMKSDIWSFGVVLWELFSHGHEPYTNVLQIDLASYLKEGRRLSQPLHASDKIYRLMKKCWSSNPDERPSLSKIRTTLLDEYRNTPASRPNVIELSIEEQTVERFNLARPV